MKTPGERGWRGSTTLPSTKDSQKKSFLSTCLAQSALGYLIIQSLGTLNAADMMVALLALGIIGIVMALGIKQVEARLLRWRPEYQKR